MSKSGQNWARVQNRVKIGPGVKIGSKFSRGSKSGQNLLRGQNRVTICPGVKIGPGVKNRGDGFNPLPIFPSPRVDTLGVGKYFPVEKWSNFHDSPYFDKGEGCFAPPQGGYSVSGPTQLDHQNKYNLNTWCQALQHTSRQAYIH